MKSLKKRLVVNERKGIDECRTTPLFHPARSRDGGVWSLLFAWVFLFSFYLIAANEYSKKRLVVNERKGIDECRTTPLSPLQAHLA
jgi:hypothetical protein